jgi:hypothetical protein
VGISALAGRRRREEKEEKRMAGIEEGRTHLEHQTGKVELASDVVELASHTNEEHCPRPSHETSMNEAS